MQRILTTRKALLAKCTPHEEAFQKMVNKLLYHLPGKCKSILRYTREKAFVVTGSQWFFGDYWFKAVKLVVELDGGQHQTELARAYDEWRTQLLSAHGIVVIRFRNTEIEAWPWQELERRFLDAVFTVHHHSNIKGTLRKGLRRLPPRRGE